MAEKIEDQNVPVPPEALLMRALHDDPKFRPKLQRLVKEFNPNVRIPELDMQAEVVTALEPHLKTIADARNELAAERADRATEREWASAERAGHIRPEDRPEVEKLMQERGITNRATAAEFYAQSPAAAAPRSVMPSPFTLPAAPDMKELIANPTQWARKQ